MGYSNKGRLRAQCMCFHINYVGPIAIGKLSTVQPFDGGRKKYGDFISSERVVCT